MALQADGWRQSSIGLMVPATFQLRQEREKKRLFCCERKASLSSAAQINPLAPPLQHGFPAEAATSAGAVITPTDETKTLPSVSGRQICCTQPRRLFLLPSARRLAPIWTLV